MYECYIGKQEEPVRKETVLQDSETGDREGKVTEVTVNLLLVVRVVSLK